MVRSVSRWCQEDRLRLAAIGYPDLVTAKDLRRILRSFGCVESRQRGSHRRIECRQCVTTVPVHSGEDIGPGLPRRLERDLAPCPERDG